MKRPLPFNSRFRKDKIHIRPGRQTPPVIREVRQTHHGSLRTNKKIRQARRLIFTRSSRAFLSGYGFAMKVKNIFSPKKKPALGESTIANQRSTGESKVSFGELEVSPGEPGSLQPATVPQPYTPCRRLFTLVHK